MQLGKVTPQKEWTMPRKNYGTWKVLCARKNYGTWKVLCARKN